MKKYISLFLFLSVILIANMAPSYATDNYVPIRVGISDTSFKTYIFDSVEFLDAYNLTVLDASSGHYIQCEPTAQVVKVTSENNLFRIYIDNKLVARNLTGPIFIDSKTEDFISIANLKRKGKQAKYRGQIELVRSSKDNSKFSIVNKLSLKNYLKGVVPNEMPTRFGLEALKAQTVAARNYAVTPRVKAYQEFDVCDSVACQVYYGANTEEELSNIAIEETNGIVALDKNDEMILALYSSTAGGYTESYEKAFSDPTTKAFPSNPRHYLSAVPDCKDFPSLYKDEDAEKFYTTKPEAYDDQSPYYRWSKSWTIDELNKILPTSMSWQSKTGFIAPALENKENFGKLQSIKVLERGESGKVTKLEVKTDRNLFIVQKELVIRRCFLKDNMSLPSANFVINYIDSKTPVYKFFGGGFGHGVGLSQYGAGKMGSLGFNFEEILQHYYKGIKLATIPINITPQRKSNDRNFYVNKKDAYVIAKTTTCNQTLKITINDKEILEKLKQPETKIKISKYVKGGLNKISYEILCEENEQYEVSDVSAFVVVKEAEDE